MSPCLYSRAGGGRQQRRRAALGVVLLTLLGCATRAPAPQKPLLPPVANTTLGPRDVFHMEVVGESLPTEYEVAPDGTVDVPYIHRIKVAGLEPQQVARLVRGRLMSEDILTDPSVVVRVIQYRSQKVIVLGQVKSPGDFPFTERMTLAQAISQAGGLTAIAKASQLRLTRQLPKGGSQSIVVDFEAINSGHREDIQLQAGDRIYVTERVF